MCVYICIYIRGKLDFMWYFDTKNQCYYFSHQMLILKHVIFCIIYNMLYKMFPILCFFFILILFFELMFCFFVILGTLNVTVFVKYYCIQKSKLTLEMGFAMFQMTVNIG